MNDKDIMTNYLSLLKSNVEVYVHGTIESSNKKIKESIRNGLDETLNAQERTFDVMVDSNMYEVSNIKASDVKKVYNKISCQKE